MPKCSWTALHTWGWCFAMTDVPRGAIRNREYANRIRDYSGLRVGNMTPTDIDGVLDYHARAYFILELKYSGTPVPYGQRLLLERLCDDLHRSKPTLLVIAEHSSSGDIDAANCIAVETRWRGLWKGAHRSVGEIFYAFIDYLDALGGWNP